ncbi:phosphoribosyltransferase [Clavibacter michiganensis]|nr:phosphoribosyltransferase family protein [Clavibacter michiganensis]PPF65030.1 phosphoribosyltransferase [Clavibacter michiganensis]
MSLPDVISARHQVLKHFRWINGDADTWAMLAEPHSLRAIIAGLTELARPAQPDLILGIEARGFVLGPAVAAALGVGFVPVRKEGGMFPGDVIRRVTAPDYRGNTVELSTRRDLIQPGQRVVLIDDWIETGSQSLASAQLVSGCGAELCAVVTIVDETSDDARAQLPPIHALVTGKELPRALPLGANRPKHQL